MFAHALALGASRNTSGAAAAGSALTVPPIAPIVQYHAGFGVTASGSPSRVTTIVDQKGLANGTAGAGGSSLGGPLYVNEPYGLLRPLMRWEGNNYLNGAVTAVFDQRAYWMIAVIRMPKGLDGLHFFSAGQADGATAVNTVGPLLSTNGTGSTPMPYMKMSNILTSTVGSSENTIIHAGVQVVGVFCNATRQRGYVNANGVNVALGSTSLTGIQGFEIGRFSFSPGTKTDANYNAGPWFQGDVYEFMLGTGTLSDAQADAQMAAALANWSDIVALTDDVVLAGDSIVNGTTSVPSVSPAARMTEPGHPLALRRSTRVVNVSRSGYETTNLITGRDQANSMGTAPPLSGGRWIGFQIGRNDVALSARTAAQIYTNDVALINTVTVGLQQRGIKTLAYAPLAVSIGAHETVLSALTTLLADITTFRTDTGTTSANLQFANPRSITLSGQTLFANSTDAGNATYYNGGLHLTSTGYNAEVYGADTPANGWAGAFAALGL